MSHREDSIDAVERGRALAEALEEQQATRA